MSKNASSSTYIVVDSGAALEDLQSKLDQRVTLHRDGTYADVNLYHKILLFLGIKQKNET